jgi:hypothetical protein
MIISHEHRFIFIKTHKTAGTSVEVFLSRLAGESAVVTEVYPPEPGHRPRNFDNLRRREAWHEIRSKNRTRAKIAAAALSRLSGPAYTNHMPAARVRTLVGAATWRSYLTFCFERDPWEKVRSWYLFHASRNRDAPDFATWLARRGGTLSDWDRYAGPRGPIVDIVGQYQRLERDLASVLDELGLAVPVELPRAKPRPRDGSLRADHDPFTVELTARVFAREIEHFGYEPPTL